MTGERREYVDDQGCLRVPLLSSLAPVPPREGWRPVRAFVAEGGSWAVYESEEAQSAAEADGGRS